MSAKSQKSEFDLCEFLKRHSDFKDTNPHVEYEASEIFELLRRVKVIVAREPTLLEVRAPVVIVGDIHGQYEDLHRIFGLFSKNGVPGQRSQRFLFLGDYVDRGNASLECIVCLLIHKLVYPDKFNLLRGNHESPLINRIYGFFEELNARFDESTALDLWKAFNDTFSYFPLAALIHRRILCMHGGISPRLKSLDDIRNIKRPLADPNSDELACDLLWADPMRKSSGFTVNGIRGVSVYFGEDTVVKMCNKLKVDLIVRAHQMMQNGYSFFCNRRLVTVFSAPCYYPDKKNCGAVMRIDRQLRAGFSILQPTKRRQAGPKYFKEEYSRNNDDSCYISRGKSESEMEVERTNSAEELEPKVRKKMSQKSSSKSKRSSLRRVSSK